MSEPLHFPGCLAAPDDDRRWKTGVEIPGVYDGVLFWECAECGRRWHRWAPQTWLRLYEAARPYVEAHEV